MNLVAISLAFTLGSIAVLQGTINRQVSGAWGLAPAVILNNCVTFIVGLAFFFVVKFYPQWFPVFFRSKDTLSGFSWHFLLPGVFGVCIVAGMPFAISKIGAVNVFVVVVCAQMITSLVWDQFVEGIPMSWPRVAGALFAIIGVMLLRFGR